VITSSDGEFKNSAVTHFDELSHSPSQIDVWEMVGLVVSEILETDSPQPEFGCNLRHSQGKTAPEKFSRSQPSHIPGSYASTDEFRAWLPPHGLIETHKTLGPPTSLGLAQHLRLRFPSTYSSFFVAQSLRWVFKS
jgi:hypothetical protein